MSFDLDAQADAGAALAPVASGGVGQTITLTPPAGAIRNPDTGKISQDAPAAFVGSGIEQAYKTSEVDGERIQVGDVQFLLSPYLAAGGLLPQQPAIGWTATYAGKTLRVMSVQPFAPAGNIVFTYLQLRG